VGYEFTGEQKVKNIETPVPVYRVLLEPDATGRVIGERRLSPRQWQLGAAAAAVLAVVAIAAVWWQPWVRTVEPASIERMAFPLPDKPSIAVLPFMNMSGDPEQEYFADGMTEDLITDLSKVSGLFVIARSSTFTYKGRSVKVREVAEELGVRYVLEGSVRLAGDRVRINAQLIDATTGGHLWAERYDRDLGDIFALQDEIAGKIVKALEVKLAAGEQEQVARRYTDNLKAYDFFLRGRAYWRRRTGVFGKDQATEQAQQMFEKAIELDPKFAAAYAELSITHWRLRAIEGPQAKERAFEAAQKAVALDDSLPLAHTRLGWMYLWKKQHQQAIAEAKRAIALDPGFAEGYAVLASILNWSLRPEEGIVLVKKAMRLEPHVSFWYVFTLGQSYFLMGQSEEAIAALKRSITLNPDYSPTHRHLAVLYNELGRKDEARAEVAEILRIKPKDSLELVRKYCFYKNDPAENRLKRFERFIDGMRKAGMPEKSRSTKL
jgi:TolB-like protein/Tfp pilus assembly protein PilF